MGGSLVLLLVDSLHDVLLVLEDVTLGAQVEVVVHVSVDLVGISVLLQQAAKNTHSADPKDLAGHTGVSGTTSLTGASVATETLGLQPLSGAITRVDDWGLSDDETILDKLANVLA